MNTLLKIMVTAALALAATLAAASTPIQLLRAQSYVIHYPTYAQQVPTVDAVVAVLGSSPQVSVHLQTMSGTWVDVGMSYARPAGTGFQVWTASLSSFLPVLGNYGPYNFTYALKYVVNGQTYWDNNGGKNYTIAADSGSFLPTASVYDGSYHPAVAVNCTAPPSSYVISGNITLRNIAYAKAISIVYSTDNWVTSHTTGATYSASFWLNYLPVGGIQVADSSASNPNQYGFEEWSYNIPIGTATSVQYAISYTVSGQTYWDNNFGQNYTVAVTCA